MKGCKDSIDVSHLDGSEYQVQYLALHYWRRWLLSGVDRFYCVEIQGVRFYSLNKAVEVFDRYGNLFLFEPDYSFTITKIK